LTEKFFMKIPPKILFWINSVMALSFGLGFIFFPKFLYELFGFSTNEDGLLMVRFFGIVIFGASILIFLCRNLELSKQREAIMLMQSSSFFLMSLTHILVMAIRGPPLLVNIWLWILVITHLTMLGLYLFFIIRDWKEVRALGKVED